MRVKFKALSEPVEQVLGGCFAARIRLKLNDFVLYWFMKKKSVAETMSGVP